jgi:DNA-binding CsgD family transcriptional regulator
VDSARHIVDVVHGLDEAAAAVAAIIKKTVEVRDGYVSDSKKFSNPLHDEQRFRFMWTLARLLEWMGERGLPELCSFCHRSVEERKDGKPMLYCIKHAPTENQENKGGYQRGRKYAQEFQELFSKFDSSETGEGEGGLVPVNVAVLAREMLRLQFRAARNGGGSAFWALREVLRKEDACYDLSILIPDDDPELKLLHAPPNSGWSRFTELALTLRARTDDARGLESIQNRHATASPLSIARQWVRYIAWLRAGDNLARVGKGRPAEIDKATALKMKAERKGNAEIAQEFGVSVNSVNAFFARLRKRGEDVPRTRAPSPQVYEVFDHDEDSNDTTESASITDDDKVGS